MARPPTDPGLRRRILDAHAANPEWGHRRIAAEVGGTTRDTVRRVLRREAAAELASSAAPPPAPGTASPSNPDPAQALSGPRRIAVSALRPMTDEDWDHRPRGRDPLSYGGFPW